MVAIGPRIDIFAAAVEEMTRTNEHSFGPMSFQAYLRSCGLPSKKTADVISIQSIEHLPRVLRSANCMVFRLGRSESSSETQFALVRGRESVADYFLIDDQLFKDRPRTFIPDASYQDLLPYQLLGNLVETSALSLAVASGLFEEVLRLDPGWRRMAPAAGSSVYSFAVVPRHDLPTVWSHVQGQVEIDGLLLARTNSKWHLFVIEAKHGRQTSSLPKYKLAYAVMAVATTRLPEDISITPVYLRSWQVTDAVEFRISICQFQRWRDNMPIIESLAPIRTEAVRMPFTMLNPSKTQ